MWYVCNYAQRDGQGCNGGELNDVGGLLNARCHDRGGWVGVDAWAKMYGREHTNVAICDNFGLGEV